ncbi:hypothetical protein SLA2020_394510 [Shorea laevis]
MPDLGNLSYSASLTLTRCPSLKPVNDPPDPGSTQCPSLRPNPRRGLRFGAEVVVSVAAQKGGQQWEWN